MKILAIANIIVIQYLLTSRYDVSHKWEWLTLTATVLAGVLVAWERQSRPGSGPGKRT